MVMGIFLLFFFGVPHSIMSHSRVTNFAFEGYNELIDGWLFVYSCCLSKFYHYLRNYPQLATVGNQIEAVNVYFDDDA